MPYHTLCLLYNALNTILNTVLCTICNLYCTPYTTNISKLLAELAYSLRNTSLCLNGIEHYVSTIYHTAHCTLDCSQYQYAKVTKDKVQ